MIYWFAFSFCLCIWNPVFKSSKVDSPAKNAYAFIIEPGLKWMKVVLQRLGCTERLGCTDPMEVVGQSKDMYR